MDKSRATLLGIALLAFGAARPVLPQETPAPAQAPSALTSSILQAFRLLNEDKVKEARAELEHAQTLATGPCGECLLGMSYVYSSEKDWKRAKKAVNEAIPLLKPPGLVARAYNQLGSASFQSKELEASEDAFRRAVSSGGVWGTLARYNLSQVLLTRRRWAEAAEMARSYIKDAGQAGTAIDQAHIVLCQARANLPEEPRPPFKAAEEVSKDPADARKVEGQVTRPEILSRTNPRYTEEARKAKVTGTVIVEAIIDKEGCVTNVRPLHGLPKGLTESAENAVRRWVFKPATLAGEPVKVFYVLTVNFAIQAGPPPAIALPSIVP
ncbi:MAG: energy transducer TonB [Thermoanaerobaculia bacterium]